MPRSKSKSEYHLTNAAGETIAGEVYDSGDRAIDARVTLMETHPDGDAVTVEEVDPRWIDRLDLQETAKDTLRETFSNPSELVVAYRNGLDITDLNYVGRKSRQEISDFIMERDPDARRARCEQDDGICTEYRLLDRASETEGDGVRFAFICPRCENENSLKGSPGGFRNKTFSCVNCNWVVLLESNAIERWMAATDEFDLSQ